MESTQLSSGKLSSITLKLGHIRICIGHAIFLQNQSNSIDLWKDNKSFLYLPLARQAFSRRVNANVRRLIATIILR